MISYCNDRKIRQAALAIGLFWLGLWCGGTKWFEIGFIKYFFSIKVGLNIFESCKWNAVPNNVYMYCFFHLKLFCCTKDNQYKKNTQKYTVSIFWNLDIKWKKIPSKQICQKVIIVFLKMLTFEANFKLLLHKLRAFAKQRHHQQKFIYPQHCKFTTGCLYI